MKNKSGILIHTIPDWFYNTKEGTNVDNYIGSNVSYTFYCPNCDSEIHCVRSSFIRNVKTNKFPCCNTNIPKWYNDTQEYANGLSYINSTTKYHFKCKNFKVCKNYINKTNAGYNKCNICDVCNHPNWYKNTIEYENKLTFKGANTVYNHKCKNYSNCGNTLKHTGMNMKASRVLCSSCDYPDYYTHTQEYINNEPYKGWDSKYHFVCTNCGAVSYIRAGGFIKYGDRCIKCTDYSVSNIELNILNWLNSLNIKFIHSDWDTISPQELDFNINNKLAIEVNGIYWHCEENFNSKGIDGRNYHLNKTKQCEDLNINLLHIPESDILNNNKLNIWKSMIKGKLGINSRIFARKTKVIEVPLKQAQEFLKNNHLQGYAGAKYKLGLEYEGELVACMTMSKARYSSDNCYEIVRFASKLETNIVGGFSKLLKHFQRNFNIEKLPILSYADRSHSVGKVYKTNGFTLSHYSKPGYKYFKGTVLEPRERYMKHKLNNLLENFDPKLTEYENMLNNGYNRIWDCGNSVWVLPYSI